MKNEIIKIAKDLEKGTVTTEQAQTLLLGLFSVRLSLPDRDEVQEEAVKYVEENNERVYFMDTAYYEHLKLQRILDVIYNED